MLLLMFIGDMVDLSIKFSLIGYMSFAYAYAYVASEDRALRRKIMKLSGNKINCAVRWAERLIAQEQLRGVILSLVDYFNYQQHPNK